MDTNASRWKWGVTGYAHSNKESESEVAQSGRLFATPWTVAYQAPPSMGFSRQDYWSGVPLPSPGDLPDPGIGPRSPALQADALPSEPPGKSTKKASPNYLWSAKGKLIAWECENPAERKAQDDVIYPETKQIVVFDVIHTEGHSFSLIGPDLPANRAWSSC